MPRHQAGPSHETRAMVSHGKNVSTAELLGQALNHHSREKTGTHWSPPATMNLPR